MRYYYDTEFLDDGLTIRWNQDVHQFILETM